MNPTSSMGGGGAETSVVRNITGVGGGDQTDRNTAGATAQTPLITDSLSEPTGGGSHGQSNRLSNAETSVSNSTTVTELTMSPSVEGPSESALSNKSNRNMNYAKNNRVLQPHQGQNPTVERNTHKSSDEELRILGNTLVDKNTCLSRQGQNDNHGADLHHDDIFDAIADNLESSLVQNDSLNQQQRQSVAPLLNVASGNGYGATASGVPQPVNPPPSISYYQNQVNLSEPLIVRPKMPNVPGNGSAPSARAVSNDKKSKFRFKKPKSDKNKGDKSKGLSFPFFGRKLHGSSNASNENMDFYPAENLVHNPLPLAQSILCKPGPSGQDDARPGGPGHQRNLSRENGTFVDIQGKSNLDPRPVSTEVRLMNGTPIVRPTSLPVEPRGGTSINTATAAAAVPGYNIDQSAVLVGATAQVDRSGDGAIAESRPVNDNPPDGPENRLGIAEVGVAKLQGTAPTTNGQPALVKVKGKSHSSGDLSPTHSAVSGQSSSPNFVLNTTNVQSPPRPNSLQIQGVHNCKKSNPTGSGPQLNNCGNNNNNNSKPTSQLENNLNVLNSHRNNSSTSSDRNLLNNSLEYIHATQTMDRHPKKRHKAPMTAVKNGRVSLCDDRVLSQSAGNVNASTWQQPQDVEKGNKSAISLQQFGSLDINLQQVQDFEC